MIDFSKPPGSPSAAPSSTSPVQTNPGLPDIPVLPDFEQQTDPHANEAPWDHLGRVLWGTKEEGGTLGQIPLLGDIARVPGQVGRWAVGDLLVGVGVKTVTDVLSGVMGRLPSGTGLSDFNLGNAESIGTSQVAFDAPQFAANPDDDFSVGAKGKALVDALTAENGTDNMARVFLVLGQWQQKYDPEAFTEWQEVLAKAQGEVQGVPIGGAQAAEMLSRYIRDWGVTYADLTPEGVEGLYDVAPELAYAGEGSFGQGFADDLQRTFGVASKKAERTAAKMTGSQAGGIGPIPVGPHKYYPEGGFGDLGSRLNELMFIADTRPETLTGVEAEAVRGMRELGWTGEHAYNFLTSKGQGYSSNPAAQLVLSIALDPTTAASAGAGLAASTAGRAAHWGATASSANRARRAYEAGARAIGTTVAATRNGPLGPAWRVARGVVDPFAVMPGPRGKAKVDVLAAAGIEATKLGYGHGPMSNVMRLTKRWGVGEDFQRQFGVTAMNFARKWIASEHIESLLKGGLTEARRTIPEETIQQLGRNTSGKHPVGRMAGFVQRNREFWLSDVGIEGLAERVAIANRQPVSVVREALAGVGRDEHAILHATSYSQAFTDFRGAMNAVPIDEWGKLAPKIDDMVILNPHELDNLAAQNLLADLQGMKGKAQVKAWNAAAAKYSLIDSLGRVKAGGESMVARRMAALQSVIERGRLHTALDISEMKSLPEAFRSQFLDTWTDSAGRPMWRIGFKPAGEQATGLMYDDMGKLIQEFAPNVENVTEAIPMATGRATVLTDAVGRVIPQAVKDTRVARAAGAMRDSLDVAVRTASDRVSGERIMTSMEQRFRRSMRDFGLPDKVARDAFRMSRETVQGKGWTFAGMSPDDFFKATEDVFRDIVDAKVVKREVFQMLIDSAGGDMRLLGLSTGMTQRIRSGLVSRGLDADNYLGQVTVSMYNAFRYALNPTFFVQAVADAPWFNMYRGVMFDLRGKAPKPGSATYEMQQIAQAFSNTSLSRALMTDFQERIGTIKWQEAVRERLSKMPGVKEDLSRLERAKLRLGRMILNNELLFMNTQVGKVVFDAIDDVRTMVDERIAGAATDVERAEWRSARMAADPMLESIRDDMTAALGRLPTDEEVGRRYLMEIIDDSQLEVRTPEGLLNYQQVRQKGNYYKPTTVADLQPLELDYGAASLGYPNITTAAELRDAVKRDAFTLGNIRDDMKTMGFHKDAIKRFTNGLMFDWRDYFDDLARQTGMSRAEMVGIEDLVAKQAKMVGMPAIDYLSQVLPMTAKRAKVGGPMPKGRVVGEAEMAKLQERGKFLTGGKMPKSSEGLDLVERIGQVAETLHKRTALTEWGGATYSPRTGKFIEETNEYLYHGTSARFAESIGQTGITRGEFADLSTAQRNALGESVIYRTKRFDLPRGVEEKAEGWFRVGGRGVPPEKMQISRDAGVTWEPVREGDPMPDGPWVNAVGTTKSMPIEEAQDPAAFKAALDQFVAENDDILKREGYFVGTFRDETKGTVDFDVARVTFSAEDTEAVQAYLGREGGAYNVATGFAQWKPELAAQADEGDYLRFVLDVMRLAKKGDAGMDEMTQLVTSNLQPSMKLTLLEHFEKRITGPRGLIEEAMAGGDAQRAQDLNLVLEDLRGGWGTAADKEFKELVVRRAGGEAIVDPEIERAARFFSQWMREVGPSFQAGEIMRQIVDNIPVEGASPYNFTQAAMMQTLNDGITLAESDAIRLAHVQPNRSVLERSINHPFFAMYPSSYFWGKVIPETFRFLAYEPFGMKTTTMAEAYYKVKTTVDLQAQYDERLGAAWERFGKSAVTGLISYLSPSMPWEDMKSMLPPWVRGLSKGEDFMQLAEREFNTFSPERWMRHFVEAGEEIVGGVGGTVEGLTQGQAAELEAITQGSGGAVDEPSPGPQGFSGPTPGAQLGPVLTGELTELQEVLSEQ